MDEYYSYLPPSSGLPSLATFQDPPDNNFPVTSSPLSLLPPSTPSVIPVTSPSDTPSLLKTLVPSELPRGPPSPGPAPSRLQNQVASTEPSDKTIPDN